MDFKSIDKQFQAMESDSKVKAARAALTRHAIEEVEEAACDG